MNSEESGESDTENDKGFVLIANEILRKCKINGEVHNVKECSDLFFVAVYEGILGEALEGIITNTVLHEQKVANCDKVIDALSHDVLNVDLSHITGENVINGDVTTIQNLLEIFKELLDFILCVDDEFSLVDIDEQNDSNLLSSDHEVISDVLHEELGQPAFNSILPISQRQNIEVFSSNSSVIVEPELSSIPKCSGSIIPYSRNSDIDSNSTDEIIRESELLERQLTRDYPSLHDLRNQSKMDHQGHDKERIFQLEKDLLSFRHKAKLPEDKNKELMQNLPTTSGLDNLKSFEPELEQEEQKKDVVNIVDEFKNSQRVGDCHSKYRERSVKLGILIFPKLEEY